MPRGLTGLGARALLVTTLLAGAMTSTAAVAAPTWWGLSGGNVVAGAILERASEPLVVTEQYYGTIAPLAREVSPDTPFLLFGRTTPVELPAWRGEIYLYRGSGRLLEALEELGELRPACEESESACLLKRLRRR